MDLDNFFLIAGPCVVESEKLCMEVAEKLCFLTAKYNLRLVFKASYRKELFQPYCHHRCAYTR